MYTYGKSDLKVAVEFCESGQSKDSDVYFAFDNPELNMITGKGDVWQLEIYPHAPCKWRPKDVIFTYLVIFDRELLQCDVVQTDETCFIFVHQKTTPIKNPDEDLIYTVSYDARLNWRRNLLRPVYSVEQKLLALHKADQVFYQSNDVGDLYSHYLDWCRKN